MMMVSLFLLLGTAMLGLAGTSRRISNHRMTTAQALSLAMGAADNGIMELKANIAYTGYASRALGPGSVSVSVSPVSGYTNRRSLLATATVTAADWTVTKKVRYTADLAVVPLVFKKAIAARKSFSLHSDVNSAPTAGMGDVHCNQTLTINGSSVKIDGRATATYGIVSTAGKPTITKGWASGVPPVNFPDISQAYKDQALAGGSFTGNKTVSNGSLLQGKVNGSLTVGAPSGCQVNSVVWVTGNLTVSGPITGKGTIVCDGTINLNCQFGYPASSTANVVLATTSTNATAIDLGGNRQFNGTVYAPYGGINFHGNTGFVLYGGLLGDTINFSGNGTVTFRSDWVQDPPPIPQAFDVIAWEEI
jgi:hypothetical protein